MTCCHRRLHFCSLNGLAEPCGFDEIWHPMGMYIMGYHQHLWVITRNTTRKLNQSTLNVASSGSSMIRIFFWGSCGTERTEKGLNWLNATVPPLSLVHHVDCCRRDSEHVKEKPLLRPEGALEPLLWPCGGFCVREWRVLGLLGYLSPAELCELLEGLEGFGGFDAWQTAALNAYKKPFSGRKVPFPCGAMRTFGGFGGFWRV